MILIANLKICTDTVNPGMLPQHQNRCKVLQLYGHRFGANTELSVNLLYLVLSDIVVHVDTETV